MAKRKSSKPRRRWFRARSRHRKDRKFPLLVGGVSLYKAVVEPVFGNAGWSGAKVFIDGGDYGGAVKEGLGVLLHNFTGWNTKQNRIDFEPLMGTYVPLLVAFAGSKLATKFGVNKAVERIPVLGKYIKL